MIVIFERLGNSHKDRRKNISGIRAKNLVSGLVFEKITSISDATNKEFGEGQIMSLISKDAN